jgi:hypothetical protein
MVRVRKAGVCLDEKLRFAAGLFDDLRVPHEVRNPQRWQAVLLYAEDISRSPQAKVDLGQLEAIRRSGEGLEPFARFPSIFHRGRTPAILRTR